MFLSRKILELHRLTDPRAKHPGLAGILIDPQRKVAAASDGRRLVEIALPSADPKKFPAKGVTIPREGELVHKPFLLPAQTAQEILKILPKGKGPEDPSAYALVTPAKEKSKLTLITAEGHRANVSTFTPLATEFPDYSGIGAFPPKKPQVSMVILPENFRETLALVHVGKSVTLHVFGDRIVVESKGESGGRARAVEMACIEQARPYEAPSPCPTPRKPEKEAPASASVSKSEKPASGARTERRPAPAPASSEPSPEAGQDAPGPRYSGNSRFRRFRRHSTPPGPDVKATTDQRALYTYLVRTRGQELTEVDLEPMSMLDASEKIDALKLKKSPSTDESFATWPQWRKLFRLLVDRSTPAEEACEVLQGLTSLRETVKVIDEWLKCASTPGGTKA